LYCLSFFFWPLYCLSFFFWSLYCLSFFWPLYCLSFSDLRLLITPLVSSNFTFLYVPRWQQSSIKEILMDTTAQYLEYLRENYIVHMQVLMKCFYI
jgi:hypothetical protein